jgi:hypothetical protein
MSSLAVTQNGGVFESDGTDDQWAAGQAASAIGTAFFNPDGSIEISRRTLVELHRD